MNDYVEAMINYLGPTNERPQVWNEDFSRNILPLQSMRVRVADALATDQRPTLKTHGFELLAHRTAVTDLDSANADIDSYRQELHVLLTELIGANHIDVSTTGVIRRSDPTSDDGSGGVPVPFAHCDVSVQGVAPMLEWAYPPSPKKVRRIALYNFWRLLSPGPSRLPLALCDARSVDDDDLVAGSSHFLTYNFTAEAIFVKPNEAHNWSYYPQITRDDLIVFKQFDSDSTYPSQVPHSAFEDESVSENAPPRISAEFRAVAYWTDD